jgi:hypothetical protein
MKGGTITENPMLAFGPGPEGRTCGECFSFVHGYSACLKRMRVPVRKARPHDRRWPACKYFKKPTVQA